MHRLQGRWCLNCRSCYTNEGNGESCTVIIGPLFRWTAKTPWPGRGRQKRPQPHRRTARENPRHTFLSSSWSFIWTNCHARVALDLHGRLYDAHDADHRAWSRTPPTTLAFIRDREDSKFMHSNRSTCSTAVPSHAPVPHSSLARARLRILPKQARTYPSKKDCRCK